MNNAIAEILGGLALAFALDVGGTCGNGMCQRRGRDSLPVAVRLGSPALYIIMCRLFLCPRFLDFVFSRRCVTKLQLVAVGNGCLK